VANAPAWDDDAVLHFFQTTSRNLVAAEAACTRCEQACNDLVAAVDRRNAASERLR
jgi:hypothetical protein